MLVAEQIAKTYRGKGKSSLVHAVHPTSLTFENGRRYALVGESGSGKTTLARMLTGITRPSSGRITLDGQDVFSFRDRRELYKKCSLFFRMRGAP
jgi:peptide/nickel transport system ATP-binding protein